MGYTIVIIYHIDRFELYLTISVLPFGKPVEIQWQVLYHNMLNFKNKNL